MVKQTAVSAIQPWWIHSDCADDVQALVGGGFKHLPVARASFYAFSQVTTLGQWLLELQQVAPITPASDCILNQKKALALGLTAGGLIHCGLNENVISAFGSQFTDGMTEPNRARRLGDRRADQLQWSGSRSSSMQVHLVLVTYCVNEKDLDEWCEEINGVLEMNGVYLRHHLNLELRAGSDKIYREHFGFADGISQPIPTDDESDRINRPAFTPLQVSSPSSRALRKKYHKVSSGDFLFGRKNSYGEIAPTPFVPQINAPELAKGNAPIGARDFAYNGTFLVIRQLSQDVDGFWEHMDEVATRIGMSANELAEKLIGRTKDGVILSKHRSNDSNDQGFAEDDSYGLYCPLGSHVRRANPRDDGGKSARSRLSRLQASNKHRILRRGRNYTIDERNPNSSDTEPNKGLLFMCMNTDIRRQFEFIQTTWLNSRQFSSLNETDPLLGSAGTLSIQSSPVRLKPNIENFVTLVGGDYFFVPSIATLKYLSRLS